VDEDEGGFAIRLDGRAVRTPARRLLKAPTRALAQALGAEWNAQEELIDPLNMPLTRLANAIIDGVVDAPAAVAAEIERYLGSDLVLYRAEGPQGLVARQAQIWDPLVDWAGETLGARFVLAQGSLSSRSQRRRWRRRAPPSRAIPGGWVRSMRSRPSPARP